MSRPLLFFLPAFITVFALACGCANAGHRVRILGLLLEMKGDEQAKSAAAEEETRNFLRARGVVLKAKDRRLQLDQKEAVNIFGQPASVFRRGRSTVWAYKPASADWLSGEKVYLTFDEQGNLTGAEYQPS